MKWILYTESPRYHDGRYKMRLEEITYINGEWRWDWHKDNYNNRIRIIEDINKPPIYILSIIFDNYNSAVKYKEYIETKYYNKINKELDNTDKFVKGMKSKFETEFLFGTEKGIRKLKLEKIGL